MIAFAMELAGYLLHFACSSNKVLWLETNDETL